MSSRSRTTHGAYNRLGAALQLSLLWVSGCSLTPTYRKPEVNVADTYKQREDAASAPGWRSRDTAPLPERWWALYQDVELNRLQNRLLAHNADLETALASFKRSRAYLRGASAEYYPSLSVGVDASRNRQSENRALRGPSVPTYYNDFVVGAQLSYEVDLWGRVSATVQARRAQLQAAGADLAAVRLNLTAELAQDYFRLRSFDQRIGLLERTVAAYARALELVKVRYDGGVASALDLRRAESKYENARSQLAQTRGQRELVENALAELVGSSATAFAVAPQALLPPLPPIPLGHPSELLRRRPDIAAAERRTAAANSLVGVARAAFYPAVVLGAQGGFQSQALSSLLSLPSLFWSIGASAMEDLFDGGRREADLAVAKATLTEAGAQYRSVVLAAFREVQDSCVRLDRLGEALQAQGLASAAAEEELRLATEQYRNGAVSYLDVVVAQTNAVDAELERLDLSLRRLTASVQLIRALGGGWATSSRS